MLDCLAGTLKDARLVARVAPDEPHGNARLVATMYVADPSRGHCGSLEAMRLDEPGPSETAAAVRTAPDTGVLVDAHGHTYAIRQLPVEDLGFELRWTRRPHGDPDGPLVNRSR